MTELEEPGEKGRREDGEQKGRGRERKARVSGTKRRKIQVQESFR